MKLQFEPKLDHQDKAIHAVTALFDGARREQGVFTVLAAGSGPRHEIRQQNLAMDTTGYANRVTVSDDAWLKNLQAVQRENGLLVDSALGFPFDEKRPKRQLVAADPTESDQPEAGNVSAAERHATKKLWNELGGRIFTVEMETGTGKTYVYLRTIYELHRQFGLSKFIIVVPSIAIKEGVTKSIAIMREHFASLYDGVTPEDFVYDGASVGRVRSFATASRLQIMVLSVAAFNKDANVMNKEHEGVGWARPIDVLANVRPIVIVDEPQSVEGGDEGKGLAALLRLRPTCILRYSATPRKSYHRIYRLDAVDAYQHKLVKRIEVAAASLQGAESKPYVRLLSVKATSTTLTARVEIQEKTARGVRLRVRELRHNDDLGATTELAQYEGYRVAEIRRNPKVENSGTLTLLGKGEQISLEIGHEHGGISEHERARHMIRRTVTEHLDKELSLLPRGIKVLSLFFVAHVADYRAFASDGTPEPGPFALLFEEEYEKLRKVPKYAPLFASRKDELTSDIHNGYFGIDRKGNKDIWIDTKETSQAGRAASERAYSLIMKDKEKLLSLDTKLRFIFSHSALREGWDNPNVFQICVLRDMQSDRQRRQTLGRGLRLAVDQSGSRLRDSHVNRLTVIAWESYQSFAEGLQHEIETETGYVFGRVSEERFLGLTIVDETGNDIAFGEARAAQLLASLRSAGLVDASDNVTEALKADLEAGKVALPESCAPFAPQVIETLKRLAIGVEIVDADERQQRRLRRAVLDSDEFQQLWARIRQKTLFRVTIDEDKLVAECAKAVADTPAIRPTRVEWSRGSVAVDVGGVTAKAEEGYVMLAEPVFEARPPIPDLLGILEETTKLTRRSLCRILIDSGRLDDVAINPQQFVDQAKLAIQKRKEGLITDGIVYRRLDGEVYSQELFKDLEDCIRKNLVESQRSVHDFVEVESAIERSFVEQLERETSVKVYAKLPREFVIPTPLGSYNPDWALVVERNGIDRVYFVVETKGSTYLDDLRRSEAAKVECARQHFALLEDGVNPARYRLISSLRELEG